MQLKALQKKVPEAEVVGGRVIAFVGMKHYDLGQYVGEGTVILSQEGEAFLAPSDEEPKPAPRRAKKGDSDGGDPDTPPMPNPLSDPESSEQ